MSMTKSKAERNVGTALKERGCRGKSHALSDRGKDAMSDVMLKALYLVHR